MVKDFLEKLRQRADIPGRALGIDIGTTAVRAAVARRAGGRLPRVSWARAAEIARTAPEAPGREETVAALRELFSPKAPRAEVTVCALPLHRVFLRSLVVPFTRLNLIEQVISSEAELHIPFPLDQVVIDFWPQEVLEDGKTRVMMVAARKDFLAGRLELLAEAGIDPAGVGVDFPGLADACRRGGRILSPGVTALIEVGAAHTSVGFFLDGRMALLRSFTWGGDTVTAAVMKATGASFPEAESLKRGAGLPPAEAGKVEAAVGSCLARFEAEISRTLHTAVAATGARTPDRLLLTGGGAALPGLREALERLTGIDPAPADPWTGIRDGKHRLPGAEEAMGIASFAVGREGRRVNFRKEEFTWAGSWGAVRRRLLVTLGLLLGLLAAFAVSLHLRMGAKEEESAALQARISGILDSAFPDQTAPARGRELQVMEDSLKEMRDNFDYYREFSSISGLDALLELSRIIPDKLKVQVVELDINQDRVRLRARTENYGTAELIKKAIQTSALFVGDQLKESPAKTRKDGAKTVTVEFTYTIPLIRQE